MIFLKRHKKYLISINCNCSSDNEYNPLWVKKKTILTEICISHFDINIRIEIEQYEKGIAMRISITSINSNYAQESYGISFNSKGDTVNLIYQLSKRKFNKKIPLIFKYSGEFETMDDFIENMSIENANDLTIFEIEEDITISPPIKWKKFKNNQIFDDKQIMDKFTVTYNLQTINNIDIKKKMAAVIDNLYLQHLYRTYLIMQLQ